MIDTKRLCCMIRSLRRKLSELAAAVNYGKMPPTNMDRRATQFTSTGVKGTQIVGADPRRRSITFFSTGIGSVLVAPDTGGVIGVGLNVSSPGQPLTFKYVDFPIMVTGSWVDLSASPGGQVAVYEEIVTG